MRHTFRPFATLSSGLLALILSAQMFACPGTSRAAPVIFTINSSQSTATWSGIYNGMTIQPQSTGSLSATISGHFLVDFDPTTHTPSSIQFVGGHGYYELATSYLAQPAVGGGSGTAAANLAGQAGDLTWAIRDLVWDFSSAPITSSGGVFAVNQTQYSVSSGGIDASIATTPTVTSYVGNHGPMTGGGWTISESSPGSGEWTLVGTPYLLYSESFGVAFRAEGTVVAQAQYGATSSAMVLPTDTYTEALGGAAAVGGVSATFSQATDGGVFSVQQVPNETALSAAAVAAAEVNPVYVLSTSSLSAAPQIWEVNYTGVVEGVSTTLLFHYDSSLLPAGLDESTLGIWHYNSILNRWDFGGTVDTLADTIAYTTDSFSPFQLGVAAVPEPSTLIVWSFLGALGVTVGRRRRSSGKPQPPR